ncbi:MAG: hypothetical protein LBU89_14495 [Fibromonadaceae bacterium]|jgi:hypothetical protein|nr:hypothetical protein [Fibromonadaceae bacterium]
MKTLADELREIAQETKEKMYLQWKKENVDTNFLLSLREAANAGAGGIVIQCRRDYEVDHWTKWAEDHKFYFAHKSKEDYELKWLV